VGIDLHRRRSVVIRKNADGVLLSKTHIDNSEEALCAAVAAAGPEPEVVLEATFGWYWAADALTEMGARVHLAHPLGNNWGNRRVKNDERDAVDLVDLLRLGRLVEAWIAPREVRELREMVRYRHKLVRLRSGLKAQVHAIMGKHGVLPARSDMFGLGGNAQLDALDLPLGYSLRLESLRDLIAVYDREVTALDRRIAAQLGNHHGYWTVQQIHGVGPVTAAVFVAEIGDVTRSPRRRIWPPGRA
jgi:transposase